MDVSSTATDTHLLDQVDEDIFVYEVSDEALEAAAGWRSPNERGDFMLPTGLLTCKKCYIRGFHS